MKPRAERDLRYNRSEKGKSRYASYRELHRAEIQQRNEKSNRLRIFVGGVYAGRVSLGR